MKLEKISTAKVLKSLSTRLTFLMIFILSASNLLAGGVLILVYTTDLNTKLSLTPIKITIIALIVSYISSAILSGVLNKNMLKPLKLLTQATEEVASGNFDVKTDNMVTFMNKQSEIGRLVDSFNHMTTELKGTEMFRNDFIHNFSHEFKTPIISIRGFARQLYQGNLTQEQTTEFAKIIMDESEHLANMSSNVLLLTKLENQGIVSDKSTFSLDEQLRDCMLLFEEQWSQKNLTIDMDLEEITYYQNAEMLSHVWTNLIGNAIKFSHRDGTLTVKCHKGIDTIWITVTDTGIGMSPETASHVFEKFYQGDPSHSTPGNGLGLSLAKRIITMMNGRISVKSQLGQGTTFSISLPELNEV